MRFPRFPNRAALLALFATRMLGAASIPELELVHAWSVEGPGRFDASGIAIRDGRSFVVSDRHPETIFELELAGNVARAKQALTFTAPAPLPDGGYLDIEGLALAPDGGFFVASELGFAVLHVPAGGGTAEWVTPNLRALGATVGLFATRDAYVEGVAALGEGWFLVAAERQPRGLIEVMGGNPPIRASAQEMDATNYGAALHRERKLDFSDLCIWQSRVFALARNQHLVVELRRDGDGAWVEGDAWSYAQTETAAPYRYADMTFGAAEGLAITDDEIYVLLDNNAVAREAQPGDVRPWLFAFRNAIAGRR